MNYMYYLCSVKTIRTMSKERLGYAYLMFKTHLTLFRLNGHEYEYLDTFIDLVTEYEPHVVLTVYDWTDSRYTAILVNEYRDTEVEYGINLITH